MAAQPGSRIGSRWIRAAEERLKEWRGGVQAERDTRVMDNQSEDGVDLGRRSLLTYAAVAPALAIGLGDGKASAQNGSAQLPADLERAWDAYNRATIHKDVAALAALVTDDYM